LLKVHPSNYRIEGFTASAAIADLAELGVPVVGDIGSGLLAPHPLLPEEPDAASWLRGGAALVTASGDKLLGGPQAGLLLGRSDLVDALARHPLARALRVDKLTVAALEATLCGPPPPAANALAADQGQLQERAKRVTGELAAAGIDARRAGSDAAVGGGGGPARRGACRVPWPRRCGPVRRCAAAGCPPLSAGSMTGGCCWTSGRCRRRTIRCSRRPFWRHRGAGDAGHRDGWARRSRQVHAAARADRDGSRPLGRGTAPWPHHRPGLRLADAAIGPADRIRRRPRPSALRAEHAGRS